MRSGQHERDGSDEDRPTISFESLDLSDNATRLRFVSDVAGILNAGGGWVTVGVGRRGREAGVERAAAEALQAPAIAAIVDPFLAPDSVRVEVEQRQIADGRFVVEIDVAEPDELPVVLTSAGTYRTTTDPSATNPSATVAVSDSAADDGGTETEVFASGSVVVRHHGRTRPATRADFRRWTDSAVERERARLAEHLSMVLEAPAGSRLRLLTDEEVRDDPSYFLTRSADLFRLRPERVLEGSDLQYLWLHRTSLSPDQTASELLVQSALRKRATLFLWLAVLDLSPAALKAQLWAALDMRDRDKSDAARSILQVASLITAEDDYRQLQQALASSDYAHMRTAAEQWPTLADARDALASTADRGLRSRSDADLLSLADDLVAAGGTAVLRQAPPIGLEAFTRKLERSIRA